MKRTAVVLGIVAAMGLAPSLANAGNGTQVLETQLAKAQLVRSALVRPGLVESALARSALVRSAALTARKTSLIQDTKTRLAR